MDIYIVRLAYITIDHDNAHTVYMAGFRPFKENKLLWTAYFHETQVICYITESKSF